MKIIDSIFSFNKRSDLVDVRIKYGSIVNANFLNWILERCDSYIDEKIARCINIEQADNLVGDLLRNGIESEILVELHVPERLDVERLYCLQNWYINEKPFSRNM